MIVVELPTLEGGHNYIVCNTCPAKVWLKDGGKYVCDPSQFTGMRGDVKKLRPTNCPQTLTSNSRQAFAMLRQTLQRNK